MTRTLTATTALALLLLAAPGARADCAAELAALSGGNAGISKDGSLALLEGGDAATRSAEQAGSGPQEGIAKDGSLAPLQTESSASTTGAGAAQAGAGEEGVVAKDGSTPPLGEPVGPAAGVATSQEEAEAQQTPPGASADSAGAAHGAAARTAHGGVAESAEGAAIATASGGDAIARARAALAAGDEAACLRALEEARAG